MRSTLVNIGLNRGSILIAKGNHFGFNACRVLFNFSLTALGTGIHIDQRFLGRDTMRLHYLIEEILVVPPEGAAHTSDTAIDTLSCPSTVA